MRLFLLLLFVTLFSPIYSQIKIDDVGDGWKSKVDSAIVLIKEKDPEKYNLLMTHCKEVEFIINLTIPNVHYQVSKSILESKKHSYSEKPLSIEFDDGKKLIIGHFSSEYETVDDVLKEAKEVFENTELGLEGICYRI